jgi:hypothetical protein
MRWIAVALAFAVLSLAFAPAPLPKRDRETSLQKRERGLAECVRRLRELGVKWEVLTRPDGRVVQFVLEVKTGDRSASTDGECGVAGGDLIAALRYVILEAELFVHNKDRN